MGDLQLEESTLRAHGKGNKERIVPVAHTTVEIIQNYLLHDRHHYCKSELEAHVFLSQQGRPLTRQRIWQIIKEQARSVGITKIYHLTRFVTFLPHTYLKMELHYE